jgi:hypothetical protein
VFAEARSAQSTHAQVNGRNHLGNWGRLEASFPLPSFKLGDNMKFPVSIAALLCCLVAAGRAQDSDNPYRNSKVGDFVEYKGTMTYLGKTVALTARMTVTAKTDKEVTVEKVSKITVPGKDVLPQTETQNIDLTKPFDQTNSAALPKDASIKVETGKTTEKLRAAGNNFDCTWLKATTTYRQGLTTTSDMTIWISKDVPLCGWVKYEVKSQTSTLFMELSNYGRRQ